MKRPGKEQKNTKKALARERVVTRKRGDHQHRCYRPSISINSASHKETDSIYLTGENKRKNKTIQGEQGRQKKYVCNGGGGRRNFLLVGSSFHFLPSFTLLCVHCPNLALAASTVNLIQLAVIFSPDFFVLICFVLCLFV